jgi:cyclopropane fatty-acyl-phospholipid synthase-like methyltransferase
MKQVNPKLYDKKYFISYSPDFSKKVSVSLFQKKYNEISSLIKIKSNETICDYGCGTGDLSFVLSLKYDCPIIAIDYSKTAIDMCKNKNKLFLKSTKQNSNIKFLNKNNNEIPNLKNVKYIYFCDVFEHLYDHEINSVLDKISKWHQNTTIIIHTDNNNYLKYIRPVIDFINIILRKTTLKKIKEERKEEYKRHVNLTNPKCLTKKMSKNSYKLIKIEYPRLNYQTIKTQLGALSKIKPIINLSYFILKITPSLSPSFYAVYKKTI